MSMDSVPGFSVGVRKTQVTLTTPRACSISRCSLTAEEALALADHLTSAAVMVSIAEVRKSRLQAFARGTHEVRVEPGGAADDAAAESPEGGAGNKAFTGPIHLPRSRRDAALVQVLNETSRGLARLAEMVAQASERER